MVLGIDQDSLENMGIRRWNRRDPALRRRHTTDLPSSLNSAHELKSAKQDSASDLGTMSVDDKLDLVDHLQQELAGTAFFLLLMLIWNVTL